MNQRPRQGQQISSVELRHIEPDGDQNFAFLAVEILEINAPLGGAPPPIAALLVRPQGKTKSKLTVKADCVASLAIRVVQRETFELGFSATPENVGVSTSVLLAASTELQRICGAEKRV